MTIGIGMLASNGIVIAADSQMTSEIKSWHGKVSGMVSRDLDQRQDGTVIFSHAGGFAITLAGSPVGYALRAAELLVQVFDANRSGSIEDMRVALETKLKEFHEDHIIPYAHVQGMDRPYIQLLIACSLEGHDAMWHSEYSVLRPVNGYHAIGSGFAQADPLFGPLFHTPRLDLAQTILAAGFIVHQTKLVNIYCGKSTDIMAVVNNHLVHVPRSVTGLIDKVYDDHADVLLAHGLWSAIGAFDQRNAKQMTKARRAISRLLVTIHRDVFFEKDWKP